MDLRGVTSHLAHENRSSVTVALEVLTCEEAALPLGLRTIHFHSADVNREPAAPEARTGQDQAPVESFQPADPAVCLPKSNSGMLRFNSDKHFPKRFAIISHLLKYIHSSQSSVLFLPAHCPASSFPHLLWCFSLVSVFANNFFFHRVSLSCNFYTYLKLN